MADADIQECRDMRELWRVEHVTVNEGGQAIVGNVSPGGRGLPKKTDATS
jgi:hypothetical protein